jgi:T5SS/PEP-CTERM-associated repeat protein
MKSNPVCSVFAIVLLTGVLFNPSSYAQYTGYNQTNLISGVTSNWVGDYVIGYGQSDAQSSLDALLIQNGGVLSNGNGSVGGDNESVGNAAIVSGSGSTWNNSGTLNIGNGDLDNNDQLIIAKGGTVYDDYAIIGLAPSDYSGGGSVLVTDIGSVWSNQYDLLLGNDAVTLTISNGGAVYNGNAYIVGDFDDLVRVTGTGSTWRINGQLEMNPQSGGSYELIVSDGGFVHTGTVKMDGSDGSAPGALVTGAGSVWTIDGNLNMDSLSDSLTVADRGMVSAGAVKGGEFSTIAVSGGALFVTNGLGTAALVMNESDRLTVDDGTVTANQLSVINNHYPNSFGFTSGLLDSGGTVVSNGQDFLIGDGTNAATFRLDCGGTGFHSFANGLTISSNALITGCGTIDGTVTVDPGGKVVADCSGTLAFTGVVTNSGDITAVNNTSINFYGPVVNNGVIDSTAGNVLFLGGLQNFGVILPRSQIAALSREGNDIRVTWTTVAGHSYVLQSTKAAAIASYNTSFADVSPIIMAPAFGVSKTNYLDAGVAYAPALPVPSGQNLATSGAPSMVSISAANTRGIADSLGQALPIGSPLMLGTFGVSESAIQSNFFAGNLSTIMSNFTPYGTSFAAGDGTSLPASWSVTRRGAAGFGGRQIYLLAIDKPTFATATHLGIFSAASWIFPAGGGTNSIALEDVTDFVIGAQGGSLTINIPVGGETYTFTDTARLSVLPGRILFYRVRLAQ